MADCSVMWASILQTEMALSTMEVVIITLAHGCWHLFPLIGMVTLLGKEVGLHVGEATMYTSTHKDNAGILDLVESLSPDNTPRSKHYSVKTIWIHEEIDKRGHKLLKIPTTEQLGDIFMKGLSTAIFQYLQKQLIG